MKQELWGPKNWPEGAALRLPLVVDPGPSPAATVTTSRGRHERRCRTGDGDATSDDDSESPLAKAPVTATERLPLMIRVSLPSTLVTQSTRQLL